MGSGVGSKVFSLLAALLFLFAGSLRCNADPAPPERTKTAAKAPSFYVERAKLQIERRHYGAAIRSLSLAIRATPQNAEAYKLRGTAYDKIGAPHRAIQDFTRYIELKPRDTEGYILRGDTRNFSGEHEAALTDYNAAIRMSSRSIPAYMGRGLAYAALERYTLAMKDYQWILVLAPDNSEAAENMGLACMRSGKPILAVSYFERALENERDPAWRVKIHKWMDQVVNDPSLKSRKTDQSAPTRPLGPTAKPLW